MMVMHDSHVPHGDGVGPSTQLTAFARMRAMEVFPVPRGPVKRYAWWSRSSVIALLNVRSTGTWPTTSSKEPGR